VLLASSYPIMNVFWTMLEFFFLFIWIFLVISVFFDIFRSQDLSGGVKALWVLFVVVLPYLGVLIYLLARGGSMHERSAQQAHRQDEAMQAYVRQAAGSASTADELAKLADLKEKGQITDADYEKAKAKILA
jgi:ABC-type multidrug transport system fused ATPase/permease subunit